MTLRDNPASAPGFALGLRPTPHLRKVQPSYLGHVAKPAKPFDNCVCRIELGHASFVAPYATARQDGNCTLG